MSTIHEVINNEATDIEKEAAVAAHAHFLTGRRWDKIQLILGIPSTVLAACAGVTAFNDLPNLSGGIAMAVTALTALNTFLSPKDRTSAHRLASITFSDIRRQASLLRDVEAPLTKDDKEGTQKLAEHLQHLVSKMTEADQKSPPITASAKHRAEEKLRGNLAEKKDTPV